MNFSSVFFALKPESLGYLLKSDTKFTIRKYSDECTYCNQNLIKSLKMAANTNPKTKQWPDLHTELLFQWTSQVS